MKAVRGRRLFLLAAAVLAAQWSSVLGGPAAEDLGARALSHVVALTSAGPRKAGSPAERRAVEYVAGQLRAWGYGVEVMEFSFQDFEVRRVLVEVTSPRRVTLSAKALRYSPPTEATLTAPLVAAGRGLAEDFQQVDARGKVALVERGGATFLEKVENAARAGARAVVVFNHEPGDFMGTLTRPSSIPALSLPREEGLLLLALLQQGVVVSVEVDTSVQTRTSWNVAASLQPALSPRVVLGAHVDSVEGSPGANDNASGVAAALEAARLLRSRPPAWPVEVAAFGAEEGGLFGSAAYVLRRRNGVAAMLNLDMVGVGNRLLVGNTGADRRVVEAVLEAGRQVGVAVQARRMGASDHVSFERMGIPTAMLHRPDDPYYHSPQDTADKVRAELLEPVVRLAVVTLRHHGLLTGPLEPRGGSRPIGRL